MKCYEYYDPKTGERWGAKAAKESFKCDVCGKFRKESDIMSGQDFSYLFGPGSVYAICKICKEEDKRY